MKPEELLGRLKWLAALGLMLAAAGGLLIVFSEHALIGAGLVIVGLILAAFYRAGKVMLMKYETGIH